MGTGLVNDNIARYLEKRVPDFIPREISLKLINKKATTIIGPRRAKNIVNDVRISKYAGYLNDEKDIIQRQHTIHSSNMVWLLRICNCLICFLFHQISSVI